MLPHRSCGLWYRVTAILSKAARKKPGKQAPGHSSRWRILKPEGKGGPEAQSRLKNEEWIGVGDKGWGQMEQVNFTRLPKVFSPFSILLSACVDHIEGFP